ncbi:triose-phosphate transporter family-domain-containing protein [Ochromonadaceae sp. CCMP2298]|nr:triose-phosphate transporter family-domain-containing protein [Ochromonadaceae sp. CCMP2298]
MAPVASWIYIVFWISISCTMILFNKAVLDQLKFPFPMFLVFWHMLLATILTQIMSRTTNMLPGGKVTGDVYLKQLLPVSLFFAVSLVLSNKAYIYLAVSYIQMLKAFTPVAVLIFSYVVGLEQSSYTEMYIVTIICIGVALTSMGESFFSWAGFTFQSLAILAESSRLVLTNLLMKQLKLDPLSSLYYIAPLCCFFIGVACLIFEAADLPLERMQTTDFMVIMLINGAVAFTLNVAVVLLIGNTSALVLTLAGIIKDILLVFLSVTVFGSPVTPLQYAGYGLALLGLNLHKQYKKNPDRIAQLLGYILTCGLGSSKN